MLWQGGVSALKAGGLTGKALASQEKKLNNRSFAPKQPRAHARVIHYSHINLN